MELLWTILSKSGGGHFFAGSNVTFARDRFPTVSIYLFQQFVLRYVALSVEKLLDISTISSTNNKKEPRLLICTILFIIFKVCIRIRKSRSRTTPIFPGAGSTDTAINAASFLVNNLSSLTGNISGSSRSSNTKFARTGRTSNSKSGNKGRTSKNSNSNSVGSLMTLISHKQAEQ